MGGVLFSNGYVSAPVCAPSRIGLMSGQYQQRFGGDRNSNAVFPDSVTTLPQYLKILNYATGMSGKTHFIRNISTMGFDEYFAKANDPWVPVYFTTHDFEGSPLESPRRIDLRDYGKYRVDEETDAALRFIERNYEKPFFFYLSYSAPHVLLEATPEYLDRFPEVKDEKRRLCLAMISAMDDGVGKIMRSLRHYGIEENTLIFFLSDNGAPLDSVYMEVARDGSLNTPLSGEKGTLLEGGIRIPWIVYWKGQIPGGQLCRAPVISLDIAASVLAATGIRPGRHLDGLNLLPTLVSKGHTPLPTRNLFWYTRAQQAIRSGKWKLFRTTHNGYIRLVNLETDIGETENLAESNPLIVQRLMGELQQWQSEMSAPVDSEMHPVIEGILSHYIDIPDQ
jgi:uncharacterized sulfatase